MPVVNGVKYPYTKAGKKAAKKKKKSKKSCSTCSHNSALTISKY